MATSSKERSPTSLILGFCECKHCGRKSFVWNTYFVCPECGCREYKEVKFFEEDTDDDNWVN